MAARKLLVALTSFVCETNDGEVQINSGQVVAANHPAVKGRESLFEPVTAPPGDAA
ncbi:MAG TPA: hypothetical protein VFJ24_00045 [Gaiellales bacterium]|nr:hypothetical protein [Gaiellales bacterium]